MEDHYLNSRITKVEYEVVGKVVGMGLVGVGDEGGCGRLGRGGYRVELVVEDSDITMGFKSHDPRFWKLITKLLFFVCLSGEK